MKLKQKLIATILTVMMLTSYIATLTNAVIAVGKNLAEQTSKTNHANVEFNSYFEGENHSKVFDMGKEAKLYLNIKVKNTGYLKNGVVQFLGANFEVNSNSLKHDKVQNSTKNQINLKQINNGDEVVIEVPVVMAMSESVDYDFFHKITTVKFTATYIDENGKEKVVEKEVENNLNWKGTAEANLTGEISKYIPYQTQEQKGVLIQAKIKSNVKDNMLPIAKTKLEVNVPQISISQTETVKPTRITVVANTTQATNGKGSYEFNQENYQYNQETNMVQIEVENKEQNGKISWSKKAVDEYLVNFIFEGEEVFNYMKKQLEKAKSTSKTEEEGYINQNAMTGEIDVKLTINAYNSEETILEQNQKITYSIEQEKGELIDVKLDTVGSLSKGYMYANYAKAEKEAKKQTIEEKKETTYKVDYTVQVQDKTLVNNIELKTMAEKYTGKDGKEYASRKEDIYTQSVKISEAVFNKMLGEDGNIQILDKEEKELAKISKELEKDEEGNYVVDISQAKVNEIIIKTTKPITEGNIEITVQKAIRADQKYRKEQMEQFQKITLGVILEKQKEVQINLTEPVTKAQVSIGTQNLSTVVENKEVEIRVVLDTSSNENALYKNPTFQVIMPQNIEKLDIKSTDLLLEDELKIKDTKVVEQNGRKIILLTLEGTQTKYMDNGTSNQEEQGNIISKGANIVIKADITFKKLTPSASSHIYMYYTNQNTNLFEQYYKNGKENEENTNKVGLATTKVEIVSPNGVVTENHINGYDNNEISNATAEQQTQNINTNETAKSVNLGGTIVNNYKNSIENVMILGRVPFEGNKAVDGIKELGTNFTIPMKDNMTTNGIDADKIKVYYSTNGEATKELTDVKNGWTQTPSNFKEIKSYLVTIEDEVKEGTKFSFDYKAEIPAKLIYSKQAYANYKVYYDNKMPDVTLGETKEAGIVGLTTGEGPKLQVSVTSANNTAREGQIVRMIATIKNETGGLTAENAKLLITAPEGTIHTEIPEGSQSYIDSESKEKEIALGNIKPGETITKDYELKIEKGKKKADITIEGQTTVEEKNEYPGDKEIQNTVRVKADNASSEITSENYTLKILKGDLQIINTPNINETEVLRNGTIVRYKMQVKNISYDKHLNNVKLNITLPNGVKVNEISYADNLFMENKKTDGITTNGNNITINLGTLQSSTLYFKELIENATKNNQIDIVENEIKESAYIFMEIELNGFKGEHEFLITATADGIETHYSNSKKMIAESVSLKFEQKALESTNILEGTQYTYHFVIENTSEIDSISNLVEMVIPEELTLVKAQYTYEGETKATSSARDGKLTIDIYNIKAGSKVELDITVKANLLPDESEKEVTTMATLSAQGIEKIESNRIKATIEYDENAHKGQQGGNKPGTDKPVTPTTGKYKISGTAWIDENRDGERNDNEEILSGIQVVLLNKSNSEIVKDVSTGTEKITTTNEKGKYEFTNLKSGEYLVLFLYDAGKYSVTHYQKEGVAASVNSDATSMAIVLNGEQKQVGVSNTIKITNNHIRDIDIGVFVAEKFDLRLDKYISKITVTTPSSGTKVYNYNNAKLTKREVASKDVGNSQLVVEYKMIVTNEGQIDGYVKKIIDYLPEDAKFSSELNKDWYISDNNGTVYNTALENEKIQPGQSKQVNLVLSFNITNKNIGKMINNNAEIYESYNEQGLQDIDSIVANRLETEDDMSNADIMLSIATGKVVIYTTFTLIIMALLGFGVFEIKRRVLTKKN